MHPDFVLLCLLAHHHHYALPILNDFVWQFDDKLSESNVEGLLKSVKKEVEQERKQRKKRERKSLNLSCFSFRCVEIFVFRWHGLLWNARLCQRSSLVRKCIKEHSLYSRRTEFNHISSVHERASNGYFCYCCRCLQEMGYYVYHRWRQSKQFVYETKNKTWLWCTRHERSAGRCRGRCRRASPTTRRVPLKRMSRSLCRCEFGAKSRLLRWNNTLVMLL